MAFVSGAAALRTRSAFTPAGVCGVRRRGGGAHLAATKPRRPSVVAPRMSLAVGDKLPYDISLFVSGEETSVKDLFAGKKVVLVGIPGAFTGTCTMSHVPGYIQHVDDIKKQGLDEVYVIAVNDYFVMDAMGEKLGASGKVKMIADGGGQFAKAIGLTKETGDFGGTRSARYSMVVSDGTVLRLNIDTGPLDKSSAESLLAQFRDSKEKDPLSQYCLENPDADECREYDD